MSEAPDPTSQREVDSVTAWEERHQALEKEEWTDQPSRFATFVVENEAFPKSGSLIDLGGGYGQDSRFFAERGFRVTYVDRSVRGRIVAEEKSRAADVNIQILEQDLARPLNFPDGSFEIAYASLSLQYFDQSTTERLFAEIARIVKPGGTLAAIVNSLSDRHLQRQRELSPGYFLDPANGICRRYFSEETFQMFTRPYFETKFVDQRGTTHKHPDWQLIRYIGQKRFSLPKTTRRLD